MMVEAKRESEQQPSLSRTPEGTEGSPTAGKVVALDGLEILVGEVSPVACQCCADQWVVGSRRPYPQDTVQDFEPSGTISLPIPSPGLLRCSVSWFHLPPPERPRQNRSTTWAVFR